MINSISKVALSLDKPVSNIPVTTMEARIADKNAVTNKSRYNDELYQYLKEAWRIKPPENSAEIIPLLRNFVAADGSSPYQAMTTHTQAIAHLMSRMVQDNQGHSIAYVLLHESLNEAMLMDGVFNSFRARMLEPPKVPEEW